MRSKTELLKILEKEVEYRLVGGLCWSIATLANSDKITSQEYYLLTTLTQVNRPTWKQPRLLGFSGYLCLILRSGYFWPAEYKKPRLRFIRHLIKKYESDNSREQGV